MNYKDAQEVLTSKGYMDVVCGNKSVWIEQLNEDEDTALVKELNSENSYSVPLSQLSKSDDSIDCFLS